MRKLCWLLIICLILFAGCGPVDSNPKEDAQLALWLENANLEAAEAPEELYQKAKSEGILTIYTVSTRMLDVAKSFEKQYPGLIVKVVDIRADEVIEKVRESVDKQIYDCDLFFLTDVDGVIINEFIPEQKAFTYIPYDIKDKIIPNANKDILPILQEVNLISYNDKLNSSPPIKNWWELTEPEWYGKIYMPNPTKSITTLSIFGLILKHNDIMEEAYFQHYGKKFQSTNGENASTTFIRLLSKNGLNIVNSSDEVAEAIGRPGTNQSNLGIMTSSKIRLRSIGYNLQNIYDIEPFCGFTNPVNIMIAQGAKNINSAKLFVRWILGEADGQGEGYKPYLQPGAWSIRTDVVSESNIPITDLKLISYDGSYIYEHKQEIIDLFWDNAD